MEKESFFKLVALNIDALEARIVDDKNVKNIKQACEYLSHIQTQNDIWLILPCYVTK